ncbi:MAG: TSUP family transporter [Kiritimatiellae bacterium]|nr:TSUP family transporter [Kiritimatiellia bacterium]
MIRSGFLGGAGTHSGNCPSVLRMLKKYILFILITLISSLSILLLFFPNAGQLLMRNGMITPVAFAAAAFANATALGGGFLFIPLFIFIYGLGALPALKLSFATQAFGMTSGVLGWSFNNIIGRAFSLCLVGAIPGMIVGTLFYHPSGLFIKKIFAGVSFAVALVILIEMAYGDPHQEKMNTASSLQKLLFTLICALGGVLNAWVSIAIGEMVVLWLLFVWKIRVEKAIANRCSKFSRLFYSRLYIA